MLVHYGHWGRHDNRTHHVFVEIRRILLVYPLSPGQGGQGKKSVWLRSISPAEILKATLRSAQRPLCSSAKRLIWKSFSSYMTLGYLWEVSSLRPGWAILPTRVVYCSNTKCARLLSYENNNTDFNPVVVSVQLSCRHAASVIILTASSWMEKPFDKDGPLLKHHPWPPVWE